MKPDYEITPGRGIGAIILGMTKKDLVDRLGEPDEIYVSDDPEKTHDESYGYDTIKCTFSFEAGFDDRLTGIVIENGYFHIGHRIRVGIKKEELLGICSEMQFGICVASDVSDDDYPARELLSFANAGLNFWIEKGFLSMIRISPLFTPDAKIIWPVESAEREE